MEMTFEFEIQNLLTRKDGIIKAPMSPMLFAQEIAEQTGKKFDCLARIWFRDERINQILEDGDMTGHDTLIIGKHFKNGLLLRIWIDEGISGLPIASAFSTNRVVKLTNIYQEENYIRKLEIEDVTKIFEHLFANPQLLEIKEE